MAHCQSLSAQAELAALRAHSERAPKASNASKAEEIADYSVDRLRLKCRSPRIAVRFMDGEAVFTHVPSAPGKPLNIGRALRVAIARVQQFSRDSDFGSMTVRYQSLRYFRFVVWRRTNCSTWTRVTRTHLRSVRVGLRSAMAILPLVRQNVRSPNGW
jgi:hypothetical protein